MFWSVFPLIAAAMVLIWSYFRDDFVYSYATMIAGASLYFVIPGLVHAERSGTYPDDVIRYASLYVAASILCGAWGWCRPFDSISRWFPAGSFPDSSALTVYCFIVLSISIVFRLLILGVEPELLESTQWSGPQTIYLFFARSGVFLVPLGFIAWLVFRQYRYLFVGCVAGTMQFLMQILAGKRDELIEAGVVFAVCWGVILNRYVPKFGVLAAGVFAAILFTHIGVYRSVYHQHGVRAGLVAAFSSEVWKARYSRDSRSVYPEVDNYLTAVEIATRHNSPNFGAVYWNGLVHRFVPGQIIGYDNKQALQFKQNVISREVLREFGARATVGTTFTGFSDTLQAFSFFGCLVFYFGGRLVSGLFRQASLGSSACLFVYPHILVKSGMGITHSTVSVISSLICAYFFAMLWIRLLEVQVDEVVDAG